jgi:S1-C subfamily serine protease
MSFQATQFGAIVVAAVLGGGVAIGIAALVDGESDGGETQTVLATVSSSPAPSFVNEEAAKSLQEIYDTAGPGVVQVISITIASRDPFFGGQEARGLGSGFVLDEAGHIVTNYHVVEGADSVEVNFSGEDGVEAEVIGVDPSTDIAVLKVGSQARALTPLSLGNSDAVQVGDSVVAIGNPFGLDRTVTAGIVSALQRNIAAPNGFTISKAIQTDASINGGNSGGPLLNARGEVIGVNSQILTGGGDGNVGIGFAVPINTVKQVAAEIIDTGGVEHAWIGVFVQAVDEELAQTFNLPVEQGLLVAEVVFGSPAARAGLRAGDESFVLDGQTYVLGGDIVTKVDGRTMASPDDLQNVVMAREPGDILTLEIRRGAQKRTVSVTLGRQPDQPDG